MQENPLITFTHLSLVSMVENFNLHDTYITVSTFTGILAPTRYLTEKIINECLALGMLERDSEKGFVVNKDFNYKMIFDTKKKEEIIKCNIDYSVLMRALSWQARQNGTSLEVELRQMYREFTGNELCDN